MVYLECPGFLAQFFKKVRMVTFVYSLYIHIHKKGKLKEGVVRREQVERGYKTYRREILVKPALNVCHGLTG